MKKSSAQMYLIGVDEVGRGPLAGPVTLGFFVIPKNNTRFLSGDITDSKVLTPKKREAINGELKKLQKKGVVDFFVQSQSAQEIDTLGISMCIKKCLEKGFKKIAKKYGSKNCYVYLDGGLYAPEEFLQETIIRGDQKEITIGAASIIAKVWRDKYMKDLDKKYQIYEFGKHKGYGTKTHRKIISEYGFTDKHRKTFCKNITIHKR